MTDLNDLVAQIEIQTNYGPNVVLKDPFAPGATPGAGQYLLKMLKPKVTITLRGDAAALSPIEAAPWGQPNYNWPAVKKGLQIGGVVLGALVLRRLLRL